MTYPYVNMKLIYPHWDGVNDNDKLDLNTHICMHLKYIQNI
jgi:hypothetical protein